MTSQDIITRCQALAAAGLHPTFVSLNWHSDTGWRLAIGMDDWFSPSVKRVESPPVAGLPVAYRPEVTRSMSRQRELWAAEASDFIARDYEEPFNAPPAFE